VFATGWYGGAIGGDEAPLAAAIESCLNVNMKVAAVKVVDQLEGRCWRSLPLTTALLAAVAATLAVARLLRESGANAAP